MLRTRAVSNEKLRQTIANAGVEGITGGLLENDLQSVYARWRWYWFRSTFFAAYASRFSKTTIRDACALLGWCVRLIPQYFVVDCFVGMVVIVMMDPLFYDGEFLEASGATNMYEFRFLGKRILQSFFTTLALLAAVILQEYRRRGYFCQKSRKVEGIHVAEDSDVSKEERRVLQRGQSDEPVVVKRVQHKYPGVTAPAVVSATFGIPRGQCFGLLGQNGAGKSTLFRILTGFLTPTAGEAWVEQLNVVTQRSKLVDKIGYCPQENTLFDQLTIREHLHLFASLGGVPWSTQSQLVSALIDEVGLSEHDGKCACELSGGNQRKLNFALALLDYKPVLFLDEPTSGMDPAARRRTWNCVAGAVSRGCSVVLTSHSMEECDALCHRLIIMVSGVVRCIGSVQYLKGKFGGGYSIKIKLRIDHSTTRVEPLRNFLLTSLPGAQMTEQNPTMLCFKTDANQPLALSRLQSVLCQCRLDFPDLVEDFGYSQVSLENVFLQVASDQKKIAVKKSNRFICNLFRRRKAQETP